ncbi:hypothetical protein BpHYR1_051717 [Brachionus plicatilis]|uniref:Uncharacterized protein n=1 Tax=Brachionus plicatilis TaxID=10195 RepID=A0A3M7QK24_BRAPC|nr:hypothetical protein BpHYR1_051717 [Brachionus plicatilis]
MALDMKSELFLKNLMIFSRQTQEINKHRIGLDLRLVNLNNSDKTRMNKLKARFNLPGEKNLRTAV